ncbi:hypothetical protein YC2023_030130 [Brassica napus]
MLKKDQLEYVCRLRGLLRLSETNDVPRNVKNSISRYCPRCQLGFSRQFISPSILLAALLPLKLLVMSKMMKEST